MGWQDPEPAALPVADPPGCTLCQLIDSVDDSEESAIIAMTAGTGWTRVHVPVVNILASRRDLSDKPTSPIGAAVQLLG